jgi:antitoxin ParD1/3/4
MAIFAILESGSACSEVENVATMNVSLPDPMKDWVEAQVKGGKYANSSDYVRDLIRQDQMYQEQRQALVQALIEGEESGSAGKLDMEEVKRKARQRAELSPSDA